MLRWFLLLFLLLAGSMCNLPADQKELPKDIPFSDENTGVVFPPQLGSFQKTEIRINPNPVLGTRIQYAGTRIGCSAAVYIYALSEKPELISLPEFRQHYAQTRQAILNLKSITRRVEEIESVSQSELADKKIYQALRESFSLRTDGEETYHSELLLILCGDRVVKLRITVPAAQKEALRESDLFIKEFCKLFFGNRPAVFTPCDPTTVKTKL
ncbi:MAG: hypothetical protein J5858_13730 [Lentisphaeria bacterium]|nr:hypothetical protein [Lentisphaeria bacterium]